MYNIVSIGTNVGRDNNKLRPLRFVGRKVCVATRRFHVPDLFGRRSKSWELYEVADRQYRVYTVEIEESSLILFKEIEKEDRCLSRVITPPQAMIEYPELAQVAITMGIFSMEEVTEEAERLLQPGKEITKNTKWRCVDGNIR